MNLPFEPENERCSACHYYAVGHASALPDQAPCMHDRPQYLIITKEAYWPIVPAGARCAGFRWRNEGEPLSMSVAAIRQYLDRIREHTSTLARHSQPIVGGAKH